MFCGSHGCGESLYQYKNKKWEKIYDRIGSGGDIFILNHKKEGYHDISKYAHFITVFSANELKKLGLSKDQFNQPYLKLDKDKGYTSLGKYFTQQWDGSTYIFKNTQQ